MLNNVMIGRYYSVYSKVHMMNPLAKTILTFLFIALTLLANTYQTLAILFILLGLMILNSQIPLYIYFKTVYSLKFLLLFILIIGLFTLGINPTIQTIIRVIFISLYTSILTLTTPPTEIAYGLEKFFTPLKLLKIPVNSLALSISLALRFIPTIIDQANKILKSQASRGIDYYHSTIKGKILSLKSLVFPMFVLTFKRADMLADSMEVRLYNINSSRVNFRQNRWGLYDTFILLIHLLLLVVIIVRG